MKFISLFAILLYANVSYAQQYLNMKPGAELGKDAWLRDLSPDVNYGYHEELSARAWTNSGERLTIKTLIDFDFSLVPPGSIIERAELVLYGIIPDKNPPHSTLTGSNESELHRLTEPWTEYGVTWNNQPSFTSKDRITVPELRQEGEDILLDVSKMVQYMVDNPDEAFGFGLELKFDEPYRALTFASSDYKDPAKHPQLRVVFYSLTDIAERPETSFTLYPNPVTHELNIESNVSYTKLEIWDLQGKKLKHFGAGISTLNLRDLPRGTYLLVFCKGEEVLGRETFVKSID